MKSEVQISVDYLQWLRHPTDAWIYGRCLKGSIKLAMTLKVISILRRTTPIDSPAYSRSIDRTYEADIKVNRIRMYSREVEEVEAHHSAEIEISSDDLPMLEKVLVGTRNISGRLVVISDGSLDDMM